jgi:hypothetical protein
MDGKQVSRLVRYPENMKSNYPFAVQRLFQMLRIRHKLQTLLDHLS